MAGMSNLINKNNRKSEDTADVYQVNWGYNSGSTSDTTLVNETGHTLNFGVNVSPEAIENKRQRIAKKNQNRSKYGRRY